MRTLLLTLALTLMLLIPAISSRGYDTFPYSLPKKSIGDAIGVRNPSFEPSGIVYHPVRKTLLVVCDDGNLAEISDTGVLLKYWASSYTDREAVTYCPVNGATYVWNNTAKRIEEVDLDANDTITILKSYSLLTIVGKENIESVEFVPDKSSPEKGYFYVGTKAGEGVKKVRKIQLPLSNPKASIKVVGEFTLPHQELGLGDLWYDAERKILLGCYSRHLLCEMTLDGDTIAEYLQPFKAEEGICEDPFGNYYIAEDNHGGPKYNIYGGVLKFGPRKKPSKTEKKSTPEKK